MLFYNDAFMFVNGNAPVNSKNQWFLINRQGQKSAGPFEDLSEQSENIYIVKLTNKYGALDVYGNSIISPQYDGLGDFKNGFAYYLNNGSYGFVNKPDSLLRHITNGYRTLMKKNGHSKIK